MSNNGGGSSGTEEQQSPRLGKTLIKEGERILAPTRRPDGTLRKPIRIRAGYVPQDEVAIYQSKGVLLRKGMPEVPPGYDPVLDAKPKTKAAKRNERKKEKKQQAALDKGKDIGLEDAGEAKTREFISPSKEVVVQDGLHTKDKKTDRNTTKQNGLHESDVIASVACHMNTLSVSENSTAVTPLPDSTEALNTELTEPDLDKRIRALKKKIRLTENQQQKIEKGEMKPQLLEKVAKLEDWRKELKLLEDKKSELSES